MVFDGFNHGAYVLMCLAKEHYLLSGLCCVFKDQPAEVLNARSRSVKSKYMDIEK